MQQRNRHIIFTNEWPGFSSSGGIGKAFRELAIGLKKTGQKVDVVLVSQVDPSLANQSYFKDDLSSIGLSSFWVGTSRYTWTNEPTAISFAAYRMLDHISNSNTHGDRIVAHFPDYQGIAFYTLNARACGLLNDIDSVIVHAHGPTEWTRECNNALLSSSSQVATEFIERSCFKLANLITYPSEYMKNWLENKEYVDSNSKLIFLPNMIRYEEPSHSEIDEYRNELVTPTVIFLGRHEDRKGFNLLLKVLEKISTDPIGRQIQVEIWGQPAFSDPCSAARLLVSAENWNLDWIWRPELSEGDVSRGLRDQTDSLIVVLSPIENAPYVVLEAASVGAYLVSSVHGGGPELLKESSYCIELDESSVIEAIKRFLDGEAKRSSLRFSRQEQLGWLKEFLSKIEIATERNGEKVRVEPMLPQISIIVTHYKRPKKLFRCLTALADQTDPNFELIVVDDFSETSDDAWWKRSVRLIASMDGRLIQRETNGYLGAARNSGLSVATKDYVVYVDDDDIPLPNMVESLKLSVSSSGSDVVIPLSVFQDKKELDQLTFVDIDPFLDGKISYLPTGGPKSSSLWQNNFGQSLSAMRRQMLNEIGGFTELNAVGYEDFELYVRLAANDYKFTIHPEPVFLYTTIGGSMISSNQLSLNQRRVNRTLCELLIEKDDLQDLEVIIETASSSTVRWANTGRQRWGLSNNARKTQQIIQELMNCRDREEFKSLVERQLSETNTAEHSLFRLINNIRFTVPWDEENRYSDRLLDEKRDMPRGQKHLTFDDPIEATLAELFIAISNDDNEVIELLLNNLLSSFRGRNSKIVLERLSKIPLGMITNDKRLATVIEQIIEVTRGNNRTLSPQAIMLLLSIDEIDLAEKEIGILLIEESDAYFSRYPDVKAAGFAAWEHFSFFGASEGRVGFEELVTLRRLAANAGIAGVVNRKIKKEINNNGAKRMRRILGSK